MHNLKYIFTSILMLGTFALQAQTVSIFPKNDLYLEDNNKGVSNITESQFNQIIDIALASYKKEARANHERLKIKRRWDDSTVNANMRRFWGTVTINMYGGLARREEIVPDSFALVVCHELGHAYGGAPFLRSNIAAEGQADYYGAMTCLKRIFEELPSAPINDEVITSEMIDICQEHIANLTGAEREHEQEFCERGLIAGFGLGKLLAVLKHEDMPSYLTPDEYETPSTMLSYPKTVQCRLDTYRAGTLNQDRPRCWYNPEDN